MYLVVFGAVNTAVSSNVVSLVHVTATNNNASGEESGKLFSGTMIGLSQLRSHRDLDSYIWLQLFKLFPAWQCESYSWCCGECTEDAGSGGGMCVYKCLNVCRTPVTTSAPDPGRSARVAPPHDASPGSPL